MWKRWYALPLRTREGLVKEYGGEFAAAYEMFGHMEDE